ncbi:hypothetical protein MMC09_002549 [Bachmanniomyces sp. S44760]|nr:hypothetical protein [Bachmanniomyces sp. S44760]
MPKVCSIQTPDVGIIQHYLSSGHLSNQSHLEAENSSDKHHIDTLSTFRVENVIYCIVRDEQGTCAGCAGRLNKGTCAGCAGRLNKGTCSTYTRSKKRRKQKQKSNEEQGTITVGGRRSEPSHCAASSSISQAIKSLVEGGRKVSTVALEDGTQSMRLREGSKKLLDMLIDKRETEHSDAKDEYQTGNESLSITVPPIPKDICKWEGIEESRDSNKLEMCMQESGQSRMISRLRRTQSESGVKNVHPVRRQSV